MYIYIYVYIILDLVFKGDVLLFTKQENHHQTTIFMIEYPWNFFQALNKQVQVTNSEFSI